MTTTVSIPESTLTKRFSFFSRAREVGILLALVLVITAATIKT